MEKLERKQRVTFDDMTYLSTNYFSHLAPYSINLPAFCYTQFTLLLGNLTLNPNETISFSELEAIKTQVITNNLDTYSRLILTDECKKWKEVSMLQQELNIVHKKV